MALTIHDRSLLPPDFVVFYCWQDHLEPRLHRFLIRDALNAAIGRVQSEIPTEINCVLRQDSDTSGRAGSVQIADTILKKLRDSTVVIGDVTPVIIDQSTDRYYPNPNVMAEIGYAASAIGWNRVLCVFNNAACQAEQLPFDIRHRRVNAYRCKSLAELPQAKKSLETLLLIALRSFIYEISRGEIDPALGDETLKHSRDLRLLRKLMSAIHRPTVDRFIEAGLTYHLFFDAIVFWEDFNFVVNSSDFHFYDKTLQGLILTFHDAWHRAVHFGSNAFFPGTLPNSYILKPELEWDDSYDKTVRAMAKAYEEMARSLKPFLARVHEYFPEIDPALTDKLAWERNKEYIIGDPSQRARKQTARSRGKKKAKNGR